MIEPSTFYIPESEAFMEKKKTGRKRWIILGCIIAVVLVVIIAAEAGRRSRSASEQND